VVRKVGKKGRKTKNNKKKKTPVLWCSWGAGVSDTGWPRWGGAACDAIGFGVGLSVLFGSGGGGGPFEEVCQT